MKRDEKRCLFRSYKSVSQTSTIDHSIFHHLGENAISETTLFCIKSCAIPITGGDKICCRGCSTLRLKVGGSTLPANAHRGGADGNWVYQRTRQITHLQKLFKHAIEGGSLRMTDYSLLLVDKKPPGCCASAVIRASLLLDTETHPTVLSQ